MRLSTHHRTWYIASRSRGGVVKVHTGVQNDMQVGVRRNVHFQSVLKRPSVESIVSHGARKDAVPRSLPTTLNGALD